MFFKYVIWNILKTTLIGPYVWEVWFLVYSNMIGAPPWCGSITHFSKLSMEEHEAITYWITRETWRRYILNWASQAIRLLESSTRRSPLLCCPFPVNHAGICVCWNMSHEDSIATYLLVNYIEVNGAMYSGVRPWALCICCCERHHLLWCIETKAVHWYRTLFHPVWCMRVIPSYLHLLRKVV